MDPETQPDGVIFSHYAGIQSQSTRPQEAPLSLAMKQERRPESWPIDIRHKLVSLPASWRCSHLLRPSSQHLVHSCRLEEAETLHEVHRDPEFHTEGLKIPRPGLEARSLFCSVMKNRKRTTVLGIPISQRNATEKSAVCLATRSPSCISFVLPFGLRIPFLMTFDVIGLEILLLLHDITGRDDDLHCPSVSLLPLQNNAKHHDSQLRGRWPQCLQCEVIR